MAVQPNATTPLYQGIFRWTPKLYLKEELTKELSVQQTG
jgi:hypothetical protein